MGACCCLQTCNSVENVLVVWLVLGQSVMVISTMGVQLYANISLLYNVLEECIVVVYRQTTLFTTVLTGQCM